MKKFIFFISLILSKTIISNSQPAIQWQNSFGGSGSDVAYSIQQTIDGGYVIAGNTQSHDSDVTVYYGNNDYWIVKLNSSNSIQWQKTFGGTDLDIPYSIQQTSDSGYIIAGYSQSNDHDVTVDHGVEDYWIVKLNNDGIIQWQKSLGGTNVDKAYSIQQTTDGGYIVAGASRSIDGDITSHHGTINVQNDFWIVRLNSLGTILWEKSLGGSSNDAAYSIEQTTDGGFIVAGNTNSDDGDVSGLHGTPSNSDYWIVKLNNNGIIQWQKTLGGTVDEFAYCIQQTTDGGYIVAGNSTSSDGDVTFHHGSFVSNDIWVVKLNSTGTIEWQKTLGGTDIDMANFVQQTSDGGYIVTGYTNSNDGDLTGLNGLSSDYDYWIIKLNTTGNIEWQKLAGGSSNDVARAILQTSDDGYVVAGSSSSTNGDVSGNNGNSDYWIVKLSPLTGLNEIQNSITDLQVIPNPLVSEAYIAFQLSFSNKGSIIIRDVQGKIIKNLGVGNFINGYNKILWDATDEYGKEVCDGIYFISILTEKSCISKKISVMIN